MCCFTRVLYKKLGKVFWFAFSYALPFNSSTFWSLTSSEQFCEKPTRKKWKRCLVAIPYFSVWNIRLKGERKEVQCVVASFHSMNWGKTSSSRHEKQHVAFYNSANFVWHPLLSHNLVLLGRSLDFGPGCIFIDKMVIKGADLEPRGVKRIQGDSLRAGRTHGFAYSPCSAVACKMQLF